MPTSLLIAFDRFPKERELIARMILAYGEIEFAMLDILGAIFKNQQTAVRTLYQLRSESHRLNIVEAIATPWFEQQKMGGHFKEGMTAAFHCKNIRNQYAHCTFVADSEVLRLAQLEETAKTKGESCQVVLRAITRDFLGKQSAYFDYAHHQILWLDYNYRLKNDQPVRSGEAILKPKRLSPPKLNSRAEALPPR